MIEVQVKAASFMTKPNWIVGGKAQQVARNDREWFVFVALAEQPWGSNRAFVVPRDHVSAAAWIVHQNWLQIPRRCRVRGTPASNGPACRLRRSKVMRIGGIYSKLRRPRHPCCFLPSYGTSRWTTAWAYRRRFRGRPHCRTGDRPATRPYRRVTAVEGPRECVGLANSHLGRLGLREGRFAVRVPGSGSSGVGMGRPVKEDDPCPTRQPSSTPLRWPGRLPTRLSLLPLRSSLATAAARSTPTGTISAPSSSGRRRNAGGHPGAHRAVRM
jgi:hypothetical protein